LLFVLFFSLVYQELGILSQNPSSRIERQKAKEICERVYNKSENDDKSDKLTQKQRGVSNLVVTNRSWAENR